MCSLAKRLNLNLLNINFQFRKSDFLEIKAIVPLYDIIENTDSCKTSNLAYKQMYMIYMYITFT